LATLPAIQRLNRKKHDQKDSSLKIKDGWNFSICSWGKTIDLALKVLAIREIFLSAAYNIKPSIITGIR